MTDRPYFSPTQIDLACKCGEAYRRRYILGEKRPPGVAALRGTGMHGGAKVNFRQKVVTHQDLPEADIVDAAVCAFEFAIEDQGVQLSDDETERGESRVLAETKDTVAAMAQVHAREQAPDYQPVYVEQRARITLPGPRDVLGVIDLADDKGRIVDFKTAGKRKSQADADSSVQLTVYAAVYRAVTGDDPKEVSLDTLVAGKRSISRDVVSSTRGMADYKALAHRFNAVSQSIDAGAFLPAMPGSWWCSAKWCGYWATCPYVNNTRAAVQVHQINLELAAQPAPVEVASGIEIPELLTKPTPRKASYKNVRERMLAEHPHCKWCGKKLTKSTATTDHVVPLAKGGSNAAENLCLSCSDCNKKRADSGLDPKQMEKV